jgi:DNA-binding NtrC family response regulator
MHYPQVLVYERDGGLAAQLAGLWQEQRWALREPRDTAACVALLSQGGPAALVLRIGREPSHELDVLETVALLRPDVPMVVVTEPGGVGRAIEGLCWDLGARAVLTPPIANDVLRQIVVGLVTSSGQ